MKQYDYGHTLFVQPIFDLKHKIMGFECLLRQVTEPCEEEPRYSSAEATILSAERAHEIDRLDLWVFEKALLLATDEHLKGDWLTVNVSAITLSNGRAVSKIINIYNQNKMLLHKKILFEVTETAKGCIESIVCNSKRLIENGIQVALDDFGSGYNALGLLTLLDVVIIKISKQILDGLKDSDRALIVLTKTVKFVRSMGIEVVLEGIETAGHLELAKVLKVDYVQGYHLGKPCLPVFYSRSFPMTPVIKNYQPCNNIPLNKFKTIASS